MHQSFYWVLPQVAVSNTLGFCENFDIIRATSFRLSLLSLTHTHTHTHTHHGQLLVKLLSYFLWIKIPAVLHLILYWFHPNICTQQWNLMVHLTDLKGPVFLKNYEPILHYIFAANIQPTFGVIKVGRSFFSAFWRFFRQRPQSL